MGKQPPIPGLEEFISPADRVEFLKKKVTALKLELSILKIQIEKAHEDST